MKTFAQAKQKPYLLDPNVQGEDPLTIYKSFWQVISENLTWIAIFFLFILSFLLILYFKNKRKKVVNKDNIEFSIDPYAEAIQAIEELQAKKNILNAKPFVFRLSEILRIYIQKRFSMPAMELTGEEFIVEIASNPFFSGNYEDLLQKFVKLGDRVKYSKEVTEGSQINLLLDSALYFVNDTHNRLRDQETENDKELKTSK